MAQGHDSLKCISSAALTQI